MTRRRAGVVAIVIGLGVIAWPGSGLARSGARLRQRAWTTPGLLGLSLAVAIAGCLSAIT
jgi:hypothetical protein